MKRSNINLILAEALPFLAFNIIFFLLVDNYTTVRMISWGSILLSYIIFIFTANRTSFSDHDVIYSYPKVFAIYTMFVFISLFSILVIIINPAWVNLIIAVEILVVVVYLCQYFVLSFSEECCQQHENEIKDNLYFINTSAEKLMSARGSVLQEKIKQSIEKAYDAVRNGNVRSCPQVFQLEMEIVCLIDKICDCVRSGAVEDEVNGFVAQICAKMVERDSIIRRNQ